MIHAQCVSYIRLGHVWDRIAGSAYPSITHRCQLLNHFLLGPSVASPGTHLHLASRLVVLVTIDACHNAGLDWCFVADCKG